MVFVSDVTRDFPPLCSKRAEATMATIASRGGKFETNMAPRGFALQLQSVKRR